jgi:CPA2 family monovalent cation:H+ antiporter-2
MPHHTPLITTLVVGIVLAFALGMAAHRLRASPLVGYLLAGVLVGPFTPGFVADQSIASELADIGVILLLFAVGLHFSPRDLLAVRTVALPGALAETALLTSLGTALAWGFGWGLGAGFVFGLSLSVASTVVLTRALQERRILGTDRGRTAVGWLVVEDIVVVLALVLLPAAAGALAGDGGAAAPSAGALAAALGLTLAKVAAFVVLMLVVGRRVIPWVLHWVAHTGSRELFRLAVLAIALGVAYGSAELFGVSFALGAFFAGMILAESELSHQAAQETLPLRDAFAVLFFVSVGMLFDPSIVVREPGPLVATVLIVVLGNALAAFTIVSVFRYPLLTALTSAASLSQIGEFSFILAGLGVGLNLLPETGRDLVLAGAILSILLNPLLFFMLDRVRPRLEARERRLGPEAAPAPQPVEWQVTALRDHAILVGHGRVGSLVAGALQAKGQPYLVIEERQDVVERLRAAGVEAVLGNAGEPGLLESVNLKGAKWFISAIPNPFENGNLIEQARAANPDLKIIARAHSDAEIEHIRRLGASLVVTGEQEIARAMSEYIMQHPDPSTVPAG